MFIKKNLTIVIINFKLLLNMENKCAICQDEIFASCHCANCQGNGFLFSHATLVAILEKMWKSWIYLCFHLAINLKRSTILLHYYFLFTHAIHYSCSHFKVLYVCCWLRDNRKDWHDLLLIEQLSYIRRLRGSLL